MHGYFSNFQTLSLSERKLTFRVLNLSQNISPDISLVHKCYIYKRGKGYNGDLTGVFLPRDSYPNNLFNHLLSW